MDQLAQSFFLIADWGVLFAVSGGLVVGILIGAIPGLNVPLAIAVAVPLTFRMDTLPALGFLIGIYKGGTYGGSVSAILINTPGAPAAAATTLDGYPLAKAGKAGKALKMAVYSSVLGETASDLVLITVAVPIAWFALQFGPPEYFTVTCLSLTILGIVTGDWVRKGLISGLAGLFLSLIGTDEMTGGTRFTFGSYELSGGLTFVAMVIGIFAVAEVLHQLGEPTGGEEGGKPVLEVSPDPADQRVSWAEFKGCWREILQATGIGCFIGALPGLGSAIAAFVSYGTAKSRAKNPEEFGKGSLKGIAASETANNAVTGTTLVPLLTLGIPGDVIVAIMLGAFIIHDLVPGPMLFKEKGLLITAFFGMLLLSDGLHLLIALVGMPLWMRIIRVSRRVLLPIVMVLCVVGAYVLSSSIFDIWVTLAFGVLGYLMRKFGYPAAPLLIGFILGPLLETNLRQALVISAGDFSIFVARPLSLTFLVLSVAAIVYIVRLQRRLQAQRRGAGGAALNSHP
ncbi:MAG: tripartite tricarboxylate transporter permease [Candidatus Methylomirabilia bacterium]